MTPEKIKKWKENREAALDLYRTTDMNIAQISRAIRVSTATADKMVTGKNLPKFITEERKDVPVDIIGTGLVSNKDGSLNSDETEILEKTIDRITDILENCDILLRDGTHELIRMAVTNALLRERNLALDNTLKAMREVTAGIRDMRIELEEGKGKNG